MNSTWLTAVIFPLVVTVTVVEALAVLPLEAVAVAVYVVVCAGETLTVPPVLDMVIVVLSTLLVTVTWLAFCAVTVSVELCPEEICAGLALMVTVGGGGPVFNVKFPVDEKKKPVESQARIVAVCVPAASATEAEKFTEFAK